MTGRVILLGAIIIVVGLSGKTQAQPESNARSWVIWPQGAVAFPTGRFGEKDESPDLSQAKDGHETGFAFSGQAGYFFTDFIAAGFGASHTRFERDVLMGPDGSRPYDAHTSTLRGEIWAKYFPPGGYAHWRPFISGSVGFGRPRASFQYFEPLYRPEVNDSAIALVSTINWTSAVSGGIGALVPLSRPVTISVEGLYTIVATRGAGRTDRFTLFDGREVEGDRDASGELLKSKSNTNWWELRFGLLFLIR